MEDKAMVQVPPLRGRKRSLEVTFDGVGIFSLREPQAMGKPKDMRVDRE